MKNEKRFFLVSISLGFLITFLLTELSNPTVNRFSIYDYLLAPGGLLAAMMCYDKPDSKQFLIWWWIGNGFFYTIMIWITKILLKLIFYKSSSGSS